MDSIRTDVGDGGWAEAVGLTKTGLPDFCVFWRGNLSSRLFSFSGRTSGPAGILKSLGFAIRPREVFELYPLSDIGPRGASRESLASGTGNLATGFLGDFGPEVVG